MSLHSLRYLDHAPASNTTIPGVAHLPTSILDAFIPGYSFISKYLLDVFGFDISIIVSVLVLGFACTTGVHYIYRHLWASFLTYFTASVVIDAYDIIYDNLLSWAAEQEDLKRVRSLKVQSADYTDDVDDLKGDDKADDGAIFNFNSWAAKVPPRYEPDSGYHWFRHKGHWFKFSRESNKVQGGWMGMMIQDQETVRLTVLGRSTKPIKDLILDTRDRNLSKQIAKTTVRRPSPKEQRGRGRQAWNKVAVRPSRPMGTVVLDSKQKAAILRDINDFLDPATTRWYSNRGIAYRRGYLLSGPPGTGKTSLSFALAGVFGLDIYCMSLSEKTLSEEDLILLFNSLPKRCIVLLEDIDSAGVTRKKVDAAKEKEDEEKLKDKSKEKKEEASSEKNAETAETRTASMIAKEVAKAVKTANDSSERSSAGRPGAGNDMGITMSGLLNAIDGVASQEGRVLIMTTNYPEKLDDALIRPGRVDMKIEFTLASKEQICELFLRMYCVDSREAARMPTNLKQIMPNVLEAGVSTGRPAISQKMDKEKHHPQHRPARLLPPTPPRTPTTTAPSRSSLPAGTPSSLEPTFSLQSQPSEELERMANSFADDLPEATFSPAEVQGYLIMRKKDPWSALAEVAAWRDAELLKKKEKKEKNQESKGEEDKQGGASQTSSTDDLVRIEKEEADQDDRAGDQPRTCDDTNNNNNGVDEGDAKREAESPRRAESGYSALLGNIEGVGAEDEGGDSDGDSEDGDSAANSENSSVAGSEASKCSVGIGHGCDDDDDDGYD